MTTTPKHGLGKGLSALISENYTPAPIKPTEPATGGVHSLPVIQLYGGKYQPRTRFDEEALSELADSIQKNGIMQPVIVRPSETQPGKYEIVAGERRWRAAKIAGLDQLPVIIRGVTDQQALELALVENIQRQDLSPLEEAAGYQRLIEEFNYTQDELASTVGKSRSHVANLLRLLALPEEVKALLESGKLTMGHARALLTAPDPVALAHDIAKRGLNVRQAEEASRMAQGVQKRTVRRAGSPPYQMPANVYKDPDIIALEESLSENLGLRVSINDRGQTGEIVLAYTSLAQLDEILRKLGSEVGELV